MEEKSQPTSKQLFKQYLMTRRSVERSLTPVSYTHLRAHET